MIAREVAFLPGARRGRIIRSVAGSRRTDRFAADKE